MREFKVGDLVAIRPDLKAGKKYGRVTVNDDGYMDKHFGKFTKVSSLSGAGYRLEADIDWIWSPEMLLDPNDLPHGTVVKVREDLKLYKNYGDNSWASGMAGYSTVTVRGGTNLGFGYTIMETGYQWTPEMFDKVVSVGLECKSEPTAQEVGIGDIVMVLEPKYYDGHDYYGIADFKNHIGKVGRVVHVGDGKDIHIDTVTNRHGSNYWIPVHIVKVLYKDYDGTVSKAEYHRLVEINKELRDEVEELEGSVQNLLSELDDIRDSIRDKQEAICELEDELDEIGDDIIEILDDYDYEF